MAKSYPRRLVHVTGIDTISAVLDGLPRAMRTKILAAAVEDGAKPLVAATKFHARRSIRTGALYLSIGQKVKKYEDHASAVAIVGPQRGYFRGRKRLGKGDDFSGAESPSHRAHLIEYGHHIAKGGALRAQHTLVLTETGKVSAGGKAIKRWKRGAVKTAAKGTISGWVQPRPYMRPGFQQSKPAVALAVLRGVQSGIEKARAELVNVGAHAA